MARHLVLGSITQLTADNSGCHALVGSHGGLYTAATATAIGVASLVCHDAGIGLQSAGIEGLTFLEKASIPGATVDFRSARIGDAADMLARGLISRVNDAGAACGVAPGMTAADAFVKFQASKRHPAAGDTTLPDGSSEGRHLIAVALNQGGHHNVLAVDSASLIRPADADAIVVTGSHGGLPGGKAANAVKALVRCVVFNDAGVGIDGAGISRLPVLDVRGIAGLTVAAQSARIGEALSTYQTGVISHANGPARSLGAEPGQPLREFIHHLVNQSTCQSICKEPL
ncbi:hypothetical protein HBA54_27130 [Pelagibius litoralis]|uniref:Uncharacterized protein n=1 Tax=Pelagibius litoralis TaxID=374515 RepID=A0A967KIG9_9PROT|nr:hypothetical protein [Pelagibius litoralis]NIA72271.1 hypothetical protein [Pelagibius litoralis]